MLCLKWPCYKPILSTKLVSHVVRPSYFHLLLRRTSCLSALCLSQAVTRRLWHKNTVNWSELDSQRSHQLFPVKAKRRRTGFQNQSGEMEPKCCTLLFLRFNFLFILHLFLHQTGNVTRGNVREMSCLHLTHFKANWFISLYGSRARVSIIILKTSTSAQSHDLLLKTRETLTGTGMYTYILNRQIKGPETYTVRIHMHTYIKGLKCVGEKELVRVNSHIIPHALHERCKCGH